MWKVLLLLIVAIALTPAAAQTQRKFKILLITGESKRPADHPYGTWHHEHYNHLLAEYVKDFATIRATSDLSVLRDDSLNGYDMIINNSLFLEPNEKQQEAFFKFVESGKPYFVVHAGHVSFVNARKYTEMLGGRFIQHDDFKTFEVKTCDYWYGWEAESNSYRHPIVKGVEDFKTADELYFVQFTTPDVEVIARAEYHPIMWTRNWRKGKVLCLTLGHAEMSQQNPGFQALFTNGAKWLLGILDKPGSMSRAEAKK